MFATVFSCLLAAIALPGVKGERLVTRAFLDANNVRVGDPLVLTVDFLGDADFSALHPPALASRVDTRFWRIDDRSAKTETVESARRLVYRVRPMREGCYDFPSLAFAYVDGSSGATNTIRTQPLPVHVKAGAQAALAALEDESAENALPDGLFVDLSHSPWRSGAALSADARFAWRRACAQPSAAAFAAFGFPEARLNAAACELMEGHWAKAKAIYESLEWRIGQTPAVSRGLRAVQVLATGDPAAELPAWRQALHPVLRYGWRGRLACLGALSLAVALLLFALSRLVRRIVFCLTLALSLWGAAGISPAVAQSVSPFEEMAERMRREMDQMFEDAGFGARRRLAALPEPALKADVVPDGESIRAGEPFAFIVSVTCPKDVTLSGLTLRLDPCPEALVPLGSGEAMTDLAAADTNAVVRRVAIQVRCDAPFRGVVSFQVEGRCEQRLRRGQSLFSASRPFSIRARPRRLEVAAPPAARCPASYAGTVAAKLSLRLTGPEARVETNDVVALDIEVSYKGYIPPDALPDILADDRRQRLVYRLYARAEGAARTPDIAIPYYDLKTKSYAVASVPGVRLRYESSGTNASPARVAVNLEAPGEKREPLVALRFAPRRTARTLAWANPDRCRETERDGEWVRLDDGGHAGWAPRSEWDAGRNRPAPREKKGTLP